VGVKLELFVGSVGFVGVVRNFVSARLPPCNLLMARVLCAEGVNCVVHSWCRQGCRVEGCSHSRNAHPSISMACSMGIGWGGQCVGIHLRQPSYWARLGSVESPFPRWHRHHGGSRFSIGMGLSVANNGEMCICVMGVPLSRCFSATWNGHV